MKEQKTTTIKVKGDTKKILDVMKKAMGFNSYDEVIKYLIDEDE